MSAPNERFVCIHGHFYQPPRENPWLEEVEIQDSAYPYHDWNERITAECYAPNSAARLLDGEGRISQIINVYSRISFNYGPTLLSWLERHSPETYHAILAADKESRQRFSGHGSAVAQVYNHMIMPLANLRDKYTQVIWGIRDFTARFGRLPEGMWLPETAVDLETLDVLAECGITFTIMAPRQAKRVRLMKDTVWSDVSDGSVDPKVAYLVRLPSGRSINVIFYDGPISQAIAFQKLLDRGENLVNRLMSTFSATQTGPQLVHVATDGETYGHHHTYGEMALAYALTTLEQNKMARLTNYAEFLDLNPPSWEAEIIENSSWSCAHGIERWRSNCGCYTGGHPDWNQQWRTPLRDSLNWLRDTIMGPFEKRAAQLLKDPWEARNDYINVLLEQGSKEQLGLFFRQHARQALSEQEQVTVLKLLELQRHAMLMYTSCGWFFNEPSGIETVQVLRYSARVIHLYAEIFGKQLERDFLTKLEQGKSNIPEYRTMRTIYEKLVRPSIIDFPAVAGHYAIHSLFDRYPDQAHVYSYNVTRQDEVESSNQRTRILLGYATVESAITGEKVDFGYCVLHFSDYHLRCSVHTFRNKAEYDAARKEVLETFYADDDDFAEVFQALDRTFGVSNYALTSLFRDEQRTVLNGMLEETLHDDAAVYRRIYEHQAPMMRFLAEHMGAPLPWAFQIAAGFVINTDLLRIFRGQDLTSVEPVREILSEAKRWNVVLNESDIAYAAQRMTEQAVVDMMLNPGDPDALSRLDVLVKAVKLLPFHTNTWDVQNRVFHLMQRLCSTLSGRLLTASESDLTWLNRFVEICELLGIQIMSLRRLLSELAYRSSMVTSPLETSPSVFHFLQHDVERESTTL